MDTTISKMLKLIATAFVAGCVADGYLAIQANEWGYLIGFCWAGAVFSGIFTVIWAVLRSNLAELLGSTPRSEITNESIIGTAIAMPTLLAAICFVGAGVAAGMHGKFDTAHWLLWGGAFCCGVLNIVWACAEYSFVEEMKKNRSRTA